MYSITATVILALLASRASLSAAQVRHEGSVCSSRDIRSLSELGDMRYCRLVDGSISIAALDFTDGSPESYATDVEEISDFLLVYRVFRVQHLHLIFPKLRVIRGRTLFMDRYALVVHENLGLWSLGLATLQHIQQGDIYITNNYDLCYINTVNWRYLMANETLQHLRAANNRREVECPLCPGGKEHCWGNEQPQQCHKQHTGARNCLVWHADEVQCVSCSNARLDSECIDECPVGYLVVYGRECITKPECNSIGYHAIGGACLESCPGGRQPPCNNCSGAFVIRNRDDIAQLTGCEGEIGSLHVDFDGQTDRELFQVLQEALVSVHAISNYLRVQNTRGLTAIDFFNPLNVIHGRELVAGKYSVVLINNRDLTETFSLTRINHGSYFVHLNPRLCFSKTLSDAGAESILIDNGEDANCNIDDIDDMEITDQNATAFHLSTSFIQCPLEKYVLGYAYYYRKAQVDWLTSKVYQYHCSYDGWQHQLHDFREKNYILGGLHPNTAYQVVVRPILNDDTYLSLNTYSYLRTGYTTISQPQPVRNLITLAKSPTKIKVYWWPPCDDAVYEYIVSLEHIRVEDVVDAKPSAEPTNCGCVQPAPEEKSRPMQVDYYHRALLIYARHVATLNMDNIQEEPKEPRFERTSAWPEVERKPDVAVASFDPVAHAKDELYRILYDIGVEDVTDHAQQLVHPPPFCRPNEKPLPPTYKNCLTRRFYDGTRVPSNTSQHTFERCAPNTAYRVAVRACVRTQGDGCSEPFYSSVRTLAEEVEEEEEEEAEEEEEDSN